MPQPENLVGVVTRNQELQQLPQKQQVAVIADQHNPDQHNSDQHNSDQHNLDQHNLDQHNPDQHNLDQDNSDQHNPAQHNPDQHNPGVMATANIPLKMPEYFGSGSPQRFIQMFDSFCALSGVQDGQKAMAFGMTLQDSAKDWFYSLPTETSGSWELLKGSLITNYELSTSEKLDKLAQLFTCKQWHDESAADFIIRMKNLMGEQLPEETVVQTIIKAVNPEFRPLLLAKQPKTYTELTDLVKTVQGVRTTTEEEKVTALQQQVATLTQLVQSGFGQLTRQTVGAAVATEDKNRLLYEQRTGSFRNRSSYQTSPSPFQSRPRDKPA